MSKPNRSKGSAPSFLTGEQRINKLLAAAGFGSRRQVDELLTEGRVEIDGKVVKQVGIKVNADEAKILVDGEPLKRHKPVYYAVHKPAGFLCTNADPEGRPRVIELVPSTARLFPVGRLDSSSTGLILLTNDGELAQRLAHPKHCVPKTYFVVVAGQVEKEAMHRLQRGIYLAEGIARVDGAKIRKVRQGCTEIDITLSEGKNREIRRVLARLGHKVVVLRRTAIGPLKLADMPEGSYRALSSSEVAALYQAVEEIKKARNQDRRERKKRADENAARLASTPPKKGSKPPKSAPAIYNEEADWDENDEIEEDFNVASMSDSLPPMAQNPYRTEDDEDDDEQAFNDSILVSDVSSDEVFSNRRGAVISYDEDFEGGSDEDLDDFENVLSDDGDGDGDELSDAPSSRSPRQESGFRGGRREGGSGGQRREGGFRGERREGGFSGPRREGGFRGERREGGFGGPRREGGFRGERREGGFGGPRREGGFRGERREGGFGGPRQEGGFRGERREGGAGGPRREGGFRGERREGGFSGPRQEGGFRGERREGGSGGPRREGGFRGERREGGFGGPRQEGGFRGERREGGFSGPRREGGFGGGRREFSRDADFGGNDQGGERRDRSFGDRSSNENRGGYERRPSGYGSGNRGSSSRGSGGSRNSGGRGPREGRIEGGGPSGGRPGFGRPSSGGRRFGGGGGRPGSSGRPGSGGRRGGPGGGGGRSPRGGR